MTPEEKTDRIENEKLLRSIMHECRVVFPSEEGYTTNDNERKYGQHFVFNESSGLWKDIEATQDELIFTAALSFFNVQKHKKANKIISFEIDSRPFYRFKGTPHEAWSMGYILTTNKI